MARRKKPDYSMIWNDRIDRMRKYQDAHAGTWRKNEKLLFGDTTGSTLPGAPVGTGESVKGLAYAWGLIEGLITRIYVANPTVVARPRNRAQVQLAKVITQIVETDLEDLDLKSVGNQLVVDCFWAGYGAEIEVVHNVLSDRVAEVNEITGQPAVTEVSLDAQDFEFRRIYPKDVLFDPQGIRLDMADHRYAATFFYPTLSWVMETAKQRGWKLPLSIEDWPECGQATRESGGARTSQRSAESYAADEKDPAYRTVAVLEIYDKADREPQLRYALAEDFFYLGEAPWPADLRLGGRVFFPITTMAFTRATRGFYPKPELDLIAPQLTELALVDRLWRDSLLEKTKKLVTVAGIADEQTINKMVDLSSPRQIIQLDLAAVQNFFGEDKMPPNFNVHGLLAPLDDLRVDRDLPGRYMALEQQINHILGYGPAERAGMPSTRTAREATIIASGMESKLQKRMDAVDDFTRMVAVKHIQFLQQTLKIERHARNVAELQEMEPLFAYTADQIAGEFAFSVYAGSGAPKNTAARRAEVMEMAQTLGPMLIQQGYDLRPLVEIVAETMRWPEADEIFSNVRAHIKGLAAAIVAVKTGQAAPEALMEMASKVVFAGLSQQEVQALGAQLQQQGAAPAPAPDQSALAGDPRSNQTGMGVS